MKNLVLALFCLALLCLCACGKVSETQIWNVEQYESLEDIVSIEKLDLSSIKPAELNVSTYKIIYYSDDCIVVSYLSIPNACMNEQVAYPCIIFNRGGNREFGANKPEDIAYLAQSSEKIIFATQYRGVDGGTGSDEFGGADLHDVLKLIDLCEEFIFVDKEQLYMIGVSRGGMMTYMAVREDERIKKAAVVSGLADSFMSYEEREDMQHVYNALVRQSPISDPEAYEKRSATLWAEEIKCPILIIHSKLDERVSYEQAEKMANTLESFGKEYEFICYDDDVHGLHQEDFAIIMNWFR